MSTDEKMIADLALSEEKLATLKLTYSMIGKFAYGWSFDPAIIPVSHITPLLAEYAQWRHQHQLTDAKPLVNLHYELTGETVDLRARVEKRVPELFKRYEFAQATEYGSASKPKYSGTVGPARKDKANAGVAAAGTIDYSAAIGEMMEDAK